MVYGTVTAGYGHVGRQAENVLGAVRRVLYGRLVVESSASVLAERALVAVLVRLQFAVVAGEIVFVPCLRGYHAVGRTFILEVCRVAQRYERRRTVAAQFRLRREGVVVAVGRQEIAVVLVPCLGVLVAFAVLHGCAGEVALHIVVGNVVFLDRLAVDRIVAFGVEVLGDNLAEAEELALVAVALSVAVLEGRRHDGAVVVYSVINGKARHHPLAARKPVSRGGVFVVEGERAAEGVCDGLQHIRPADCRARHFQLVLLVGLHYVEEAVAVNVL